MKKVSIILCLQFCYFLSFSQRVLVAADKFNLLYVGVANPLTKSVDNYLPEQIIVRADKGEITGGMGEMYIYRGYDSGLVSIIAINKNTQKEIGRSYFRLKKIPNPVAKVSSTDGGIINTVALRSQSYIRAELDGFFPFDLRFTIKKFKVDIIKKGKKETKIFENFTNKFSYSLEKELKLLKEGDVVIFKEIAVEKPDASVVTVKSIIFICSDSELEGTCLKNKK